MACCGKHLTKRPPPKNETVGTVASPRGERTIVPYEQCAFCAEKHVSDAWDLALECGYESPNRQTIIGALGSAERHLAVNWPELAARLRAARHLVQLREEFGIAWGPLLKEIDGLASKAAADLKKENGYG